MPKVAYGEQLQTLDHLAASVPSDEPELSHLAPLHETLKDALKDIRTAKERQLELRAAAQQATRHLEVPDGGNVPQSTPETKKLSAPRILKGEPFPWRPPPCWSMFK
jgi:septal ring factor EnvC (AmiA/AmiB activator)